MSPWRELPAAEKGRILIVVLLGCWLVSVGYVLIKIGVL